MYYKWFQTLLAGLLLSGCTHYISADSLGLVNRELTFSEVKRNPDSYTGSYLLLGGKIVQVTNRKEGGEIEIVQVNLDGSGRPLDDLENSGGRFLAKTDYLIDPVIYKGGMIVSMVAQVKGKKVQPLDGVPYTYPLLAVQELHLWQPYELYGYDDSYPPYNRYSFPYDSPYSYGVCDFGFGPSPYFDRWGQDRCFPYYRAPYFRPHFPRPHRRWYRHDD